MSLWSRLHALVDALTRRLDFLPPALARLTLGLLFVGTGWGKLHSLDQVTEYFTSLGIPAAALQAPLVAGIELVGGLLLLAGLLTRVAALPLAGTMVVAILTAQRDQIHGLSDLTGLTEFTYIVLLVWLAVAGAGSLSLDALLGRLLAGRRARAAALR
jgi:putative oxidoreductase